jgi:hypothetical protein
MTGINPATVIDELSQKSKHDLGMTVLGASNPTGAATPNVDTVGIAIYSFTTASKIAPDGP